MKILKQEMQRCVGHTAWAPEGRQGRSQGGGPLDFKYEIMLFLKAETTWPRIESDEGSNTLGIYEGSLTIKECCNAPRTNSIRMGEKSPRASSWSKSTMDQEHWYQTHHTNHTHKTYHNYHQWVEVISFQQKMVLWIPFFLAAGWAEELGEGKHESQILWGNWEEMDNGHGGWNNWRRKMSKAILNTSL